MGSWLIGVWCTLAAAQAPRAPQAPQAPQASVAGSVRDARTGEPVANATVALADIGRVVLSDSTGRYEIRPAAPGVQRLTVRRLGYAQRTLQALVPASGVLEINVALHREPQRLPRSEIHPRIAVRGLDDTELATFPNRHISSDAMATHPMLAEPDAFLAAVGGEVAARPELPAGLHLRGGAGDETAYLLDGVPVFSPYHVAGTFSALNPDALAQVTVVTAAPSPALPDALAGTLSAATRTPMGTTHARGSMSTTQARMTVDGTLSREVGYLLSARTDYPARAVSPHESIFLQGNATDALFKLETPLAGGRLRLLGYNNDNAVDIAASAESPSLTGQVGDRRNLFAWASASAGTRWTRPVAGSNIDVLAWVAMADADARWLAGAPDETEVASDRRDTGVSIELRRSGTGTRDVAGLRVQRSRTAYRASVVRSDSALIAEHASTPVVAAFASRRRAIGRHAVADVGLSAAALGHTVYVGPRLQMRWSPAGRLAISASADRSHQFAQSLRNSESVLGVVFPADLYLGAGSGRVPVSRSDRAVVAAELRPTSTTRLGVQAFVREFSGLVLVAPQAREPFATRDWHTGSGRARGVSLDAGVSGARYGVVASYGWQRVRLTSGASTYTPAYAPEHTIDAGVLVTPTPTTSIRLGAIAAIGRRVTPLSGAIEWEACNLIDRGCELAGSPRQAAERVGVSELPAYARVDLTARKVWRVRIGSRDVTVAGFAAVTNLLDRRNVLAVLENAPQGTPSSLALRPIAPLVAGFDWVF